MPPPPVMCLLHADFHSMTVECRAVAVTYVRSHPDPFRSASRLDYLAAVERAMLDNHIREHLREAPPVLTPPHTDPATCPTGTHTLERAA